MSSVSDIKLIRTDTTLDLFVFAWFPVPPGSAREAAWAQGRVNTVTSISHQGFEPRLPNEAIEHKYKGERESRAVWLRKHTAVT